MNKPTILLLSAAFLTGTTFAQTTINFNSSGQLSANLNIVTGSLSEVTTGGVANSGAVSGGTTLAAVSQTGLSSSVGVTPTASISFSVSAVSAVDNSNDRTQVRVGFVTSPTASPWSGPATLGSFDTAGAPDLQLASPNFSSAINGTGPGSISLTPNSWYRLDLTLTKNSTSGNWTYGVNLYDLGSAGTGAATYLAGNSFSNTTSTTNALNFYNAGTLYPAFSFYSETNGGVPTFDNFTYSTSAIPEPSTYAALFGAAALGLAFWRRRVACPAQR